MIHKLACVHCWGAGLCQRQAVGRQATACSRKPRNGRTLFFGSNVVKLVGSFISRVSRARVRACTYLVFQSCVSVDILDVRRTCMKGATSLPVRLSTTLPTPEQQQQQQQPSTMRIMLEARDHNFISTVQKMVLFTFPAALAQLSVLLARYSTLSVTNRRVIFQANIVRDYDPNSIIRQLRGMPCIANIPERALDTTYSTVPQTTFLFGPFFMLVQFLANGRVTC